MTVNPHSAWFALAAGLALAAPAAAETPDDFSLYSETLMWRLEPPAGGAPSFMVGTVHMVDERLQPSLDRALARLHEAGALVVEVELADAAQSGMMAAMLLPEGRALTDLIGEDRFARLAAIVADYGIPAVFLEKMAPWGAAMTISIPAEQLQKMAAGIPVFDQTLVLAADDAGLPVETLESIEEQVAALSGAPEADQVEMLNNAIDMHDELTGLVATMVELYIADDLRGLAELLVLEMDLGDDAMTERAFEALVTERNHRMAERVAPLLAERPHLVAIGAMHLPGEDGVLSLLARQGWTVTPMP